MQGSKCLVYRGCRWGFPDVLLICICTADVCQLLVWNVQWRKKLGRDTNWLCSFRVNKANSQRDFSTTLLKHIATAVSSGTSKPSHLGWWQIQSVCILCCPGTLILLARYLSCQHTFFTFPPALTGLVSGSVFPSCTAPSWGGHRIFMIWWLLFFFSVKISWSPTYLNLSGCNVGWKPFLS